MVSSHDCAHVLLRSVFVCGAAGAALAQGGLQDLGTLPGHATGGATLVNDVGDVFVGSSGVAPVRWTSGGGVQDLGLLWASQGWLGGMNRDGSVVVGTLLGMGSEHPFRWDTTNGMQDLGLPFGTRGRAHACNADGSVLVGMVEGHAMRWTMSQGFHDLGDLGSWFSWATAVNDDGSVVVGFAWDAVARRHAFRWTASSGMMDLGTLPGVGYHYEAGLVSADGSVVVGSLSGGGGFDRAFHWTAATGMRDLGDLGGGLVWVSHLTDDGSILVGSAFDASLRFRAFRWTAATGMQPLDAGVDGLDTVGTQCTNDGTVVIGSRTRPGTSEPLRPFRWTVAGGFEDLGTLGGDEGYARSMNANGSVVVGSAKNMLNQRRPFVWQRGVHAPLGATTCAGVANSTGTGGRLQARGSLVASTNFLRIDASMLPASTVGIVLASTVPGFSFPVANSQGALCLGGTISRFTGPLEIGASGPQGAFEVDLDLTSFPTPTGSVAVAAGDTWTFQVWYRDVHPVPTSNFTEAVAVRFL